MGADETARNAPLVTPSLEDFVNSMTWFDSGTMTVSGCTITGDSIDSVEFVLCTVSIEDITGDESTTPTTILVKVHGNIQKYAQRKRENKKGGGVEVSSIILC
jgi:type 1 fimbria pilin